MSPVFAVSYVSGTTSSGTIPSLMMKSQPRLVPRFGAPRAIKQLFILPPEGSEPVWPQVA
jgi:hypothetical protein